MFVHMQKKTSIMWEYLCMCGKFSFLWAKLKKQQWYWLEVCDSLLFTLIKLTILVTSTTWLIFFSIDSHNTSWRMIQCTNTSFSSGFMSVRCQKSFLPVRFGRPSVFSRSIAASCSAIWHSFVILCIKKRNLVVLWTSQLLARVLSNICFVFQMKILIFL